MMDVQIKVMEASHKPAIIAYMRRIPEFTPEEVALAEELIDIYLVQSTKSGYHFLVAEIEGKTVGYVCYGPTPITEGTWDFYWMATDPVFQNKGIGSALMEALEIDMKKAGARMSIIETSSRPIYERQRRLYMHRGYVKLCEISDFYAPGDGRVIFQKKFAQEV